MTEALWLAATDPAPLRDYLHGRLTGRQLRLFAVACCRPLVAALDAAELFADDECGRDALAEAQDAAYEAFVEFDDRDGRESAAHAVHLLCRADGLSGVVPELTWEAAAVSGLLWSRAHKRAGRRLARSRQARWLRDIAGNPFRPVAFDPAWRTPAVRDVARGVYAARAFDRLPVLADALDDAGCDAADLLAHLRQPGPHTRGCWALDLALGPG